MFTVFLLVLINTQTDTIYDLRDFRLPQAGVTSLHLGTYLSIPYEVDWWNDGSAGRTSSQQVGVIYGSGGATWRFEVIDEDYFLNLRFVPGIGADYRYRHDETVGTLDSSYTRINTFWKGSISETSEAGYYIRKSPFFLILTNTIGAVIRQDTYEDDFDDLIRLERRVNGGFAVGPGVGRTRSVTPVVHAWEFLEEIDQASYDNIQVLAELLARKWTYHLKYWRYEKYFYTDVEKLLVDQGISAELTPKDLMRLREIISSMQPGRRSGTRVWVGAGGNWDIYDCDYGDTFYTGSDFVKKVQAYLVGGYPLSRRWQLSWEATLDLITPDFDRWENHQWGKGGIAYYVGDRWELSLGVEGRRWDESQTTEKWERPPDPEWGHIDYIILPAEGWWFYFPLEVRYYLEDKFYLYSEVGGGFVHHEYPNFDESISSWGEINFDVGFTWRLR